MIAYPIFAFLHEQSSPKDFVSSQTIICLIFTEWLFEQESLELVRRILAGNFRRGRGLLTFTAVRVAGVGKAREASFCDFQNYWKNISPSQPFLRKGKPTNWVTSNKVWFDN